MADGSGTTAWSYDAIGRTLSETQGSTHRTLAYQYDAHNQRTDLTITSSDSGVTPWVTSYGYDNAGRLRAVLDDRLPGSALYTYSYHENASLVAQITSPTGLKTVKAHDPSGRLTSISGQRADGTVISSFSYTYNAAGQRDTEVGTEATRSFGYDAYRQLTQAVSKAGDTETARHEYAFDTIGNRLTSSFDLGSGAQATSYTSNNVNQYTELTGTLADVPTYDNNGNTTSLQGSTLRYDEENRLIEIQKGTERAAFTYDGFGRRVEKRTYANGVLAKTVRYVYDGWRVMEELDESYATTKSYTLGLDLSGSFEGAGGIGGLLAIAQKSGTNYTAATYFYDGNGNVTDLAADDGSSLAHYVYSPFGERITATGSWAESNPYQFSSKPREDINGLYYYGYRYYSPSVGRWLNRDPMREKGGVNLYGVLTNDLVNQLDFMGLQLFEGVNDARDVARMNPGRYDAVFVGPNGTFFTNATGPNTTAGQRNFVNWVGIDHTSGTTGVPMNADHQPPTRLNAYNLPQYLYPQSEANSNRQGGQVRELNDVVRRIAETRVTQNVRQQNANAWGYAIVMAAEGLHSWMTNRLNRAHIEDAIAQCAAQRGKDPAGCGCCTVEVTVQWEYPSTSGRFMLFGPMVYNPPGGRSWIARATGSYGKGPDACDKARQQADQPTLRAYDPGKTFRTFHYPF